MYNRPIRRRRDKAKALLGTQVTLFDSETGRTIYTGTWRYVKRDGTKGTKRNSGFYVDARSIPTRAIKEVSDERILYIDRNYLAKTQIK